MAKTEAERKSEYPTSRQFEGNNSGRRVIPCDSSHGALALHRLAKTYALTKRGLIEKLFIADDKKCFEVWI